MTHKVKIALVGCGRIASKHIDAIKYNNAACDLIALCDLDEHKALQALDSFVCTQNDTLESHLTPKIYLSFKKLLSAINKKTIEVDLIVLCTPSGLHASQAIEASRLGINVCTEKPMATTWLDGLSMVKACDQAGVQLFVVKQNRFNETLRLLKKQLNEHRFGRVYMVSVNVFWQRPQSYYDQDSWRGTWEFDGGALMNQASHYVDLLTWLIGPVQNISAFTTTLARNIEVEDTAVLNIRWRNGALGCMAVTMLTYPENYEGSITILGELGSVKIGGKALNSIDHWNFSDYSGDDLASNFASYEPDNVYGVGHRLYYTSMLKSLKDGSPAFCDGRQGLKSLELLIAAYRSSREGCQINLPLDF